MNVTVYNTETDEAHVTKDLSNVVGTWSGTIRGEIDVVTPEVLINSNIVTGNYAYIQSFGRYYWIREKTVVRENLTLLRLQSDPLMSFAAQINNLHIYVQRTSKRAETTDTTAGYNADIPDNQAVCEQGTRCRNIFVASMPIQANAIYLVAVG